MFNEPAPANDYLLPHAECLLRCYRLWTGRDLVETGLSPRESAQCLYFAPFALLSHDNTPDPLFTYANLAAQAWFEMAWDEIVGLPSRLSAEPLVREARARLLEKVAAHGFVDNYQGVRIAKSGRRFRIEHTTIWNLADSAGSLIGQAAMFYRGDTPVDPAE